MMVFYLKQKHIEELNIAINGVKINRVVSLNVLGENLHRNHHVDSRHSKEKNKPLKFILFKEYLSFRDINNFV